MTRQGHEFPDRNRAGRRRYRPGDRFCFHGVLCLGKREAPEFQLHRLPDSDRPGYSPIDVTSSKPLTRAGRTGRKDWRSPPSFRRPPPSATPSSMPWESDSANCLLPRKKSCGPSGTHEARSLAPRFRRNRLASLFPKKLLSRVNFRHCQARKQGHGGEKTMRHESFLGQGGQPVL